MTRFYLITGCSGGGKSTLVAALRTEGHSVVEEPGRRIVADETARGGTALPWVDPAQFARTAVAVARADLSAAAASPGPVFFDRGLIDAAVALHHAAGVPLEDTLRGTRHYADPVFLAPPWPELFTSDAERRHGFPEAEAEFRRLEAALRQIGHRCVKLPKVILSERVSFVLRHIDDA